MAKSKMSKVAEDAKPVDKIADKQLQELKELQLKLKGLLLELLQNGMKFQKLGPFLLMVEVKEI